MKMLPKLAMVAALLCPLIAAAERHNYEAPAFVPGRDYHTGHSARPNASVRSDRAANVAVASSACLRTRCRTRIATRADHRARRSRCRRRARPLSPPPLAEKLRATGRSDPRLLDEAETLLANVTSNQAHLIDAIRDLPSEVAGSSRLQDTHRALCSGATVLDNALKLMRKSAPA